jgi:WD40 repeat protein
MNGSRFAVFSPDGRTIATVGYPFSRDANLFDVETGTLRFSMVGHTSPLSSASFSIDDGSKLATGSHDGTCKVWDSSTGELLRTIILGTSVGSVAWGRDWVRDTQRGEAFAMGHHPRLGVGSRLLELEVGVVRMILDRV